MAGLKDIQRKIKSVQNTQKITKAMKLVSTAKLKKAEELTKRAKEYAKKLNDVIIEIAYQIEKFKIGGVQQNRFFEQFETKNSVDLVFVTADKGLCGGFNSQTIKNVLRLKSELEAKGTKVRLRAIGRKGVDFF